MSRLDFVTFAIVAACVVALIFLVYKTMKMYTKSDTPTTNTEETIGDTEQYDDENTYTFDEEDGEEIDDTATTDATNTGNTSGTDSSTSSDNGEDEVASNDNKSSGNASSDNTNSNTNSSPSSSSSNDDEEDDFPSSYNSNDGRYMVLAGSYQQEVNAKQQAAKLRRMGYEDAEVSKFNRGAYASVLVDRFDSQSDARSLERELKNKGIEAYVLRKRGSR